MTFELNSLETLIVLQALGYMCLDENVHPDDRNIAYKVKEKINLEVQKQMK